MSTNPSEATEDRAEPTGRERLRRAYDESTKKEQEAQTPRTDKEDKELGRAVLRQARGEESR